MDWTDILAKIKGGGNDRTEIRRSLDDWSAIGKAACAFANTKGGVIILGAVNNQEIVGIGKNANRTQERLVSFLQSCCGSPVSANLGMHKCPRGWVHWIEIPRQRGFKPLRYEGNTWVRRGRNSVEPSPVELQSLYNAFGYVLTEGLAMQAATVSDINANKFRMYLQKQGLDTETEPQTSYADDLRSRNVAVDLDGELRPTLYGIMAFGKDPQGHPHTGDFMIECVAYGGDDRDSTVLLSTKATGNIDEQVRQSIDWLASLGRFESHRGLIREDRPMLPSEVLRESLVNAVTHRDYAIIGSKILLEVFEERVVVTSPGVLPNRMNVERVKAGWRTRARNKSMAHYMLVSGLMEQRGRGWPVMRHAMRRFNGTEPDIIQSENDMFVRVRFYLKPP